VSLASREIPLTNLGFDLPSHCLFLLTTARPAAVRPVPRKGAYKLVRLAVMFGHEASLETVVYELLKDCKYQRPPWGRPPGKYDVKCGARLGR